MVGICWVTKIFRVLDCSESAFDDKMARILTGQSQIQVKSQLSIIIQMIHSDENQNQKYSVFQVRGPLIREVAVKGGEAVYQKKTNNNNNLTWTTTHQFY